MKTIIFAALIALSSAAAGQPYVAGGLASARNTAGDLHDTRTDLALGVGYKMGHFAGEAGCFGTHDCSVSALGSLPLGAGFSAVGKLGLHRLKGSIHEDVPSFGESGASPSEARNVSWSGWAGGIGLGAAYDLTKAFSVRALLEQTGSVGPLDRARTFSASVLYSF
jgi:hypothetical protein